MNPPRGPGSNPWIREAAHEVRFIMSRWGLSSIREASDFLGINRQTLSKLDPRHPDGTLRLESLDRIYATFLHRVPSQFPKRDWETEREELMRSRWRVLERSYPTRSIKEK